MKIDKIAPLGVTPLPAELNPNAGTQNPHCGSRQPYSGTQTSHFLKRQPNNTDKSQRRRFESHESRCRQVFKLHKYPDRFTPPERGFCIANRVDLPSLSARFMGGGAPPRKHSFALRIRSSPHLIGTFHKRGQQF